MFVHSLFLYQKHYLYSKFYCVYGLRFPDQQGKLSRIEGPSCASRFIFFSSPVDSLIFFSPTRYRGRSQVRSGMLRILSGRDAPRYYSNLQRPYSFFLPDLPTQPFYDTCTSIFVLHSPLISCASECVSVSSGSCCH